MRDELEGLVKNNNFKFNLRLIIDKDEKGWKGGVGFINRNMVDEYIPKASDSTLILICGPPIMCKNTIPILKDLGHKEDNIFEF